MRSDFRDFHPGTCPAQSLNETDLGPAYDHRTQDQGAAPGLLDDKSRALLVTLLLPDLFGHDDLPLLRHVNYANHGGKLPLGRLPFQVLLERLGGIGNGPKLPG